MRANIFGQFSDTLGAIGAHGLTFSAQERDFGPEKIRHSKELLKYHGERFITLVTEAESLTGVKVPRRSAGSHRAKTQSAKADGIMIMAFGLLI